MKHKQIEKLTNDLIDLSKRETAKAELLNIVTNDLLPEIEKVHIISIAEMHILSRCNMVKGFQSVLHFLCTLKQEIKIPHLSKFINEHMFLENGKLRLSPYVERKLPLSDYYSDSTDALDVKRLKTKTTSGVGIITY